MTKANFKNPSNEDDLQCFYMPQMKTTSNISAATDWMEDDLLILKWNISATTGWIHLKS